ncbi:hypothetical protein [Christiangramia sediminis]|uniref:SxtJ n=1 Tax=Christiangramia sediminis TaxID=2881336 RepID=A0A9X1LJZ7_9FLAO|nr:hypothetical protein [Christiangramia sediminis]MCB7481796.1 hypothetical protein [Christiangramia sediminis]
MLDLSRRQSMETGILLAMGFIMYGWYIEDWKFPIIGAAVLLVSLIIPVVFKPLAFLWFGLGKLLSFITSNLLLILLFFLLVTPVGLFRKILGKDSLKLKNFKRSSNSVLLERNHIFNPSDLKNPF